MPVERQASAWLIAERARCRREGLERAKDFFYRYPYPEAMRKIIEASNEYTAIIQNPQPTGKPGE